MPAFARGFRVGACDLLRRAIREAAAIVLGIFKLPLGEVCRVEQMKMHRIVAVRVQNNEFGLKGGEQKRG